MYLFFLYVSYPALYMVASLSLYIYYLIGFDGLDNAISALEFIEERTWNGSRVSLDYARVELAID
jgi:hypothetical protein